MAVQFPEHIKSETVASSITAAVQIARKRHTSWSAGQSDRQALVSAVTPASLQSREKIRLTVDLGTVVMLVGRYSCSDNGRDIQTLN